MNSAHSFLMWKTLPYRFTGSKDQTDETMETQELYDKEKGKTGERQEIHEEEKINTEEIQETDMRNTLETNERNRKT